MSYDQIPGYSGFLWLYDEFVAKAPPGAIAVEVGVALGHSIAYLARKCMDAGRDDIEVWGVDPWGGYARNGEQQAVLAEGQRGDFRLFLDSMIAFAPEELERIRVVRCTSIRAARLFRAADLVLIDGAHDVDSVLQDIAAWSPTMRLGSILAGDDHEPNYPGVEVACRAMFNDEYQVRGSTWHKTF